MSPPRGPGTGPIRLSEFEGASEDVRVIEARARAHAVQWGFAVLGGTIVFGLIAYVALDVAKLQTDTLREWLQTTIAAEVGLLAGVLGTRGERS